jgi:hypothetical protein
MDGQLAHDYVARVLDPYRDETDSLRAEVARLRAELGTRRVVRGKLALLLVAVEFFAILAFRPWLNGASDVKFWTSLCIVLGIAVAAVATASGARRNAP